jgi:hypothetical protein
LEKGEIQFSELYIILPDSDVFPIEPTPINPCWAVRSIIDGMLTVTIIDAVTGENLGNGVPPPHPNGQAGIKMRKCGLRLWDIQQKLLNGQQMS